MKMLFPWIWLVMVGSVASTSAVGYCATNTIPSNTSGMQLTKEVITKEYGFEDKFKSIHCCAKGYRSIEWFKDKVSYPWSAGVSNLIQYPEAANQTLYTQRASHSDSGSYTCRVSNDTHTEEHTIYLEILEKAPDAPKTTFISSDKWVEEGAAARLYCEALVGRSYLADTKNDLRWRKVFPNDTEGELLPSQTEIKTSRDDISEIIGAYLVFPSVSAFDYGTYVCVVTSNEVLANNYVTLHYKQGGDIPPSWGSAAGWRSALAVLAAILVLVSAIALHRRCTPDLLLAVRVMRERHRAPHHAARVLEKEFDVLVCYTAVDEGLVHGVLLPTLSRKYKYRVCPLRLDAQPDTDNWYRAVSRESSRCRALVAVLSPATLGPALLCAALRQLRAAPLPPVIVLLQDLPKLKSETKDSRGESLSVLVRRARVLEWRGVHQPAFWTALRLALPLPPRLPQEKDNKSSPEESSKVRSGSLTALV